MHQMTPTNDPIPRPTLQTYIEGLLLEALPRMQSLTLLGHKYLQNHKVGRNFQQVKMHGDYQWFINTLTTEEVLAIYEAIILARMVLSESKQSIKMLGDQ